nr:peptidoglycan DD-metalloendopeptidase family protein [Alkalimarinus sediminis]
MLSACNSSGIYQDKNFNPPVYFGSHKVSQGDTLYSIAWRYGRDYKELASANGISPPYTIQLGQRIRLDLRGKVASKPKKTPSASHKKSKPVKSVSKNTSTAKPKKQTRVSTKSKTVKGVNWHWPHLGQIIARYSSAGNNNKGIDIAGNLGDSVVSAANGEVVYAGSGLLGYGKLIIINHNQHYLSAYAHNDRILVKEGQTIKQGQKIAEMGNTGTNRTKLHFEIRRDGKPVNPLNYLPKR